jgi:hypothetical protein
MTMLHREMNEERAARKQPPRKNGDEAVSLRAPTDADDE